MNCLARLAALACSLFFLAVGPAASAAEPPRPVKPAVVDRLELLPPGSVALNGWLGKEIEICREARIFGQVLPDLIRPFATRPEDKMWQCEFWGKWFTSAALCYRYRPDAPLRAVIDKAVAELLATQTPDGYIGSYKKAAETKGWDVWGRKYVLLGLLAYYDLTGDAKALEAARREADYTMGQIGPGKADIVTLGMWTGMAASSILEPMVLLYGRTGEQRYLDFAYYILGQWETPKGPDLVRKALAGTAVYNMFPKPDSKQKGYMAGGSSKAYEMMSCYEGLLELHRITGKPEFRQAAEKVFANIDATEITIIGSGSSWERWCNGHVRQTEDVPEWMETCVTVTWIKFAGQLLRLTGQARYADRIEQGMYNAMIAAHKTDGTWWCHYNPLEGARGPAPEHCNMHQNCCVASGPRGLMLVPALSVMRGPQGPVVNFYEPGTATAALAAGQKVQLTIAGGYPAPGDVEITVQPEKAESFTLALRIPRWSRTTKITVNGQPAAVDAQPGTYAALARAWKPGDRVKLEFDWTVRAERDPGGSGRMAVLCGPIVLCVDKRLLDTSASGSAKLVVDAQGRVADARRVPSPAGMRLAYEVPLETTDGKRAWLRLCDYASAGRTWGEDSTLRVWLPQPLDLAQPLAGIPAPKAKH